MANLMTSSGLTLLVIFLLMNGVDGRRDRGFRSDPSTSALTGTDPQMTRGTWKALFSTGTVYGGQRYLLSDRYRRRPDKMPTICRNTLATDVNGTVYNFFVCPRFDESDDHGYCCGEENREYCCRYFDSQRRTIVISAFVGVFVIVIGSIAYLWWMGKMCKAWRKDKVKKQSEKEMKEAGGQPPYTESFVYMSTISAQTEPSYPEKSPQI